MKKLIGLLLVLVLVLTACSTNNQKDNIQSQESNASLYDFTLKDLEGNEFKLSDQKGKKVYIKFWASWCPVCLSTLPEFDEMAGGENNFELVTIVSPGHGGEKDKEDFMNWFTSLDYKNTRVLLDETGEVFENYGVKGLPSNAIIDDKGNLVRLIPGGIPAEAIKEVFDKI